MAHGRQNKRNVRKRDEIMNQWSKAYLEIALKCLDLAMEIETDENTFLSMYCASSDIKNLLDETLSKEEQ